MLGIIIILIFGMGKVGLMIKEKADSSANCAQVVDTIYDQCKTENTINITTLKGNNVQLTYDRGVCIIK